MGAPAGNQNAKHSRRWQQAIFRALARASNLDIDKGLDQAADKLVALALDGDRWALDHLADRVDGKTAQAIQVQGEDGLPLGMAVIFHEPGRLSEDRVPAETRLPLSS